MEGKLPEQSELEKMQKCAKTENIVIDEQNSTVFIKEKCTKLNLGAVAKGYAVEQVTKKNGKSRNDIVYNICRWKCKSSWEKKNSKKGKVK